jgi:hypothetical protein
MFEDAFEIDMFCGCHSKFQGVQAKCCLFPGDDDTWLGPGKDEPNKDERNECNNCGFSTSGTGAWRYDLVSSNPLVWNLTWLFGKMITEYH